jgi:hypothetical protein
MRNAQNGLSYLGKVLRIRLSTAPDAQGYTIPPENPHSYSDGKLCLHAVTQRIALLWCMHSVQWAMYAKVVQSTLCSSILYTAIGHAMQLLVQLHLK